MNKVLLEKNQLVIKAMLDKTLEILSVPEGYDLKDIQGKNQNDVSVLIFRFEKVNGENNDLWGEHYSFTINKESGNILGFTWMDQRFIAGQELPTEKQTKEIAESFLNKVQSGLFNSLENLWIRPHDEIITVDGQQMTVTGMKYKCYLPDKDTYAWVIVGSDQQIITFEQDIKWEGGRVTEKWLHDSWLEDEGY